MTRTLYLRPVHAAMATLTALLLTLVLASVASAHLDMNPCAGGSGRAYAEHHVVPLLQGAGLSNPEAHAPGSHQGFSICVP